MADLGQLGTAQTIPSAGLAEMQQWAATIMAREPDFIIGDDYLRRWWVIPRNPFCNVYLHEILHSDDDRALHDHPWANRSVIIAGTYIEVTPDGEVARRPGDIVEREAEALHRLVVVPGGRVVSLFMTGPVLREWGFACPNGWVPWRDFVDARDTGKVGRGCGEHDPFRPTTISRELTEEIDTMLDQLAAVASCQGSV